MGGKTSVGLRRPLRLDPAGGLVVQTPEQYIRKDRSILGRQAHHLVFKNRMIHALQITPRTHRGKAGF
jgi:hypothetical protein